MNLNDLSNLFSNRPPDKLNWGEALGLWSICNFKIIGLTIIEIFMAQAKDPELKQSLSAGLELLIVPHIEKIQQFLHKEGLEVPAVPQRKNLDIVGKEMEPNTMIEDDEIANTLREIFRLGLILDMQSLSFAVRDDVSQLLWNIVSEDYKGFRTVLKIYTGKNWTVHPATV